MPFISPLPHAIYCPSSPCHRESTPEVKQTAALCLLRLIRANPKVVPYQQSATRMCQLLNERQLVRLYYFTSLPYPLTSPIPFPPLSPYLHPLSPYLPPLSPHFPPLSLTSSIPYPLISLLYPLTLPILLPQSLNPLPPPSPIPYPPLCLSPA